MSQVTSMRRDPRVYSTLKKGAKRPVVAADAAVLERYSNKNFEDDCATFNFVTTTNICYLISSFYKRPVTSPATESGVRFQPAY
jgi:hypothetical protein